MLKIYDVECEKCKHSYEQWVEDEKFEKCEKCGGNVKKVFGTKMNFKLVYNNKKDICGWSFNNYDSSRYWHEVEKEKAKKKFVNNYSRGNKNVG